MCDSMALSISDVHLPSCHEIWDLKKLWLIFRLKKQFSKFEKIDRVIWSK
jgi:hypothetical protein